MTVSRKRILTIYFVDESGNTPPPPPLVLRNTSTREMNLFHLRLPYALLVLIFAHVQQQQLLHCATAQDSISSFPSLSISSPFNVESTTTPTGPCAALPSSLRNSLQDNGFSKVICPFGVVIAATATYDNKWLQFAANSLANTLDQDNDGIADDPTVHSLLKNYAAGNGGGIFCGLSASDEQKEETVTEDTGIASFSCQTYKAEPGNALEFKGVLQEEIFHMIHDVGYDKAYPSVFGIQDHTSSIVAQEKSSLQCVQPGWWHPENTCPSGAPFVPGNPAQSPLQVSYYRTLRVCYSMCCRRTSHKTYIFLQALTFFVCSIV